MAATLKLCTSNGKSDSVNRCVFTRGTIEHYLILIWLETYGKSRSHSTVLWWCYRAVHYDCSVVWIRYVSSKCFRHALLRIHC